MTTANEWLSMIAPSLFESEDQSKIDKFINLSTIETDTNLFSDKDTYNLAVAYYAAHLLELSNTDSSSRGALISEKEEGLTRSYAGVNINRTNITQYYEQYLNLLKVRTPNFYI